MVALVTVEPENKSNITYFVLQTDPSPSEIAFVNILPEANGDFANTLDVGGADSAVGVEIGPRAAIVVNQFRVRPRGYQSAGVVEGGITPATVYTADFPGIGLGLLLAIIGVDIVAREGMKKWRRP